MTDPRQRKARIVYRAGGIEYVSKKGAASALGVKEGTLDRMVARGEVTVSKVAAAPDGQVTMAELPWTQDPAELVNLRAETAPRSLPIRATELEQGPRGVGAVLAEIRAAHRAHVEARA